MLNVIIPVQHSTLTCLLLVFYSCGSVGLSGSSSRKTSF